MFDTNYSGSDKGELFDYIVFVMCYAGFSISRRILHNKMPKICTYILISFFDVWLYMLE